MINAAIVNDPWLRQSVRMQDALLEESIAEGAFPDPRVTIGADRAPNGQDRADLFSVGIGFDLPIFTGNRQDRKVNASAARLEAAKTERILQVRGLQASAALTAYNNDDGDFAEAVRARIAELNANVELTQMMAERAKNLASFRYLTADSCEIPSISLTRNQD